VVIVKELESGLPRQLVADGHLPDGWGADEEDEGRC
jgi:hypothetical protein